MTIVAIALGGALGSVLRYLLGNAVQNLAARPFPYGTLVVNVIGSVIIGILYVVLMERSTSGWIARPFWMIGVLGGFTTFSAFSLETFSLLSQAAYGRALANVLLSVGLCLAATCIGVLAARQLS